MKKERRYRSSPRQYFVDKISLNQIVASKKRFDLWLRYHWEIFSDIAYQRSRVKNELEESLLCSCEKFEFLEWQRGVKYKYSNDPLSAKGSLVDPGGRFNVGEINRSIYPVFEALYLARDKKTVLAEMFLPEYNEPGLSQEELALCAPGSITIVQMQGKLNRVINVGEKESLERFVDIIKNFSFSNNLIKRGEELKIEKPRLLQTVDELQSCLSDPKWRFMPMQADVPAIPQIFGQIAYSAGVEAVIYPSVKTNSLCLAIFPQNLIDDSYIEIVDSAPPSVSRIKLTAQSN